MATKNNPVFPDSDEKTQTEQQVYSCLDVRLCCSIHVACYLHCGTLGCHTTRCFLDQTCWSLSAACHRLHASTCHGLHATACHNAGVDSTCQGYPKGLHLNCCQPPMNPRSSRPPVNRCKPPTKPPEGFCCRFPVLLPISLRCNG